MGTIKEFITYKKAEIASQRRIKSIKKEIKKIEKNVKKTIRDTDKKVDKIWKQAVKEHPELKDTL